jgi:hypothetical protein
MLLTLLPLLLAQ